MACPQIPNLNLIRSNKGKEPSACKRCITKFTLTVETTRGDAGPLEASGPLRRRHQPFPDEARNSPCEELGADGCRNNGKSLCRQNASSQVRVRSQCQFRHDRRQIGRLNTGLT